MRSETTFHHKYLRTLLAVLSVVFFFAANDVEAQDLEARITLISPTHLRVEGKVLNEQLASDKNWTFLLRYADVENLGRRIDKLLLFDDKGVEVGVKKFAPGVYEASGPAARWQYEVNVGLQDEPTAAAHVSWLTEDSGLLMLGDILPKFNANDKNISARVFIGLPDGWHALTNEKAFDRHPNGTDYLVDNVATAVFAVGRKNIVTESFGVIHENSRVAFVTDTRTQWQFGSGIGTVRSTLENYEKTFGFPSDPHVRVFLFPFPRSADFGRWRAETRGSNVVIISSLMPFQSQGLNRFREQLRHELLHVWIPNDLQLTGKYDWFFEGFVLYHSLKTGTLSGQIGANDYFNTISNAYELSISERKDLSLIEASERRWEGNFTYINSRAMVTAFLCDVAILRASKGKRSLTDVLQELYKKHGPGKPPVDGNQAILQLLKSRPELAGIVSKYIEGKSPIELNAELAASGLEARSEGRRLMVRSVTKPARTQRNLLAKLGLNPL